MFNAFKTLGLWVWLLVIAVLLAPAQGAAQALGADGLVLPFLGFGGLLVNKDNIANVFINLKTTFHKAFEATKSDWQKIAMLVPSSSSQNDYTWLSKFPRMRRWVGDKYKKTLKAFRYTLVNEDWEATIRVDRNDIEDDNLGIYAPQAQSAGWSAKQLPEELVFEVVNKGFDELCYDGQPFFDTDHPVGDESVSNKFTVPLSISSLAAAQGSFGAVRTAMRKMKDEEGRPLNVNPNILLVPPALGDIARALMASERLEDGKLNPYRGTCEVVESAYLTSDTAWYLLDTTQPVRPFVYQERKKPVFVQQVTQDSDDVFERKEFKFGAEARAAAGYAHWQLAAGSTGTGA